MDSEQPKLSWMVSRQTRPPEISTPPLHAAVSIPFVWEEAPGKPRNRAAESKPKTSRALDLPPRLLFQSEAKVSNVPSPTAVLDGPYMGRTMSLTSSSRNACKDYLNGSFASSRWTSFMRNREKEEEEGVDDSFDFSNCTPDGRATRARTSRAGIRRRRSFLGNISSSRSHLWGSICEGLRQVVPWSRKQSKMS